MSIKGKVR